MNNNAEDIKYYTIVGARGNTVTAVNHADGVFLQRYAYSPSGKIDRENLVFDSLRHLYRQGWNDLLSDSGTIYASGKYHDPLQNGVFKLSAKSYYLNQHDEIKSPAADPLTWNQTSISIAYTAAMGTLGFFTGGPVGAVAGVTFAAGVLGAERRHNVEGQSLADSLNGGFYDATGISGIYEGIYNQDIMTQEDLNLSVTQRRFSLGMGILAMAPIIGAIGRGAGGAGGAFARTVSNTFRPQLAMAGGGAVAIRATGAIARTGLPSAATLSMLSMAGNAGRATQHATPFKTLSGSNTKLLKAKIDSRTISRQEYKRLRWHERFANLRRKGVRSFWRQERNALLGGKEGTRNWTASQIDDIIARRTPKFEGKPMQVHHRYNAMSHPHLADKAWNMYPATQLEHLLRWHGGNMGNSTYGEPLNLLFKELF